MTSESQSSKSFKLSLGDITYILLSQETDSNLAVELKVSRQCISQVRLGQVYKHVAPNLPRRPKQQPKYKSHKNIPSDHACNTCVHWKNQACGLDIPEALEDKNFAYECNYFETLT